MTTRFATILSASILGLALPDVALAGAQGVGLVTPPAVPDNTRVRTWLMNEPGDSPPRLVCVDEPTTSCFDLVLEQPAPNFPTRIWSPDCPAGPALRNCRADEIPGTGALSGKLAFSSTPDESWAVTDVSAQHPFDGNCAGGVGTLGVIQSPPTYFEAFDLQVGNAPYADTNFVSLFSVPPSLGCASWIQTSTLDAANTGASQLSFTIGTLESYVFVAYQDAATPPSWLSSAFTQTPATFQTDLATMRVWRSNQLFARGAAVTLGSNRNGGGDATHMYLVVVRPPDALQLCGSYTASVTLEQPGLSTPVSTRSEASCYHQAGPDREFLTPQPLELPGGIGFLARDVQPLDCSVLPFGDRLEVERSFMSSGLLTRVALRKAAQLALPAQLCVPNTAGKCTLQPSVALLEPTGELATGTASGGACTFPVDFTLKGQTRVIVYGGQGFDVDTDPPTELAGFAFEHGLVKDVDVSIDLPFPAADEVRSTLIKGTTQRVLDGRNSCSTFSAATLATFDDAATAAASVCGDLAGRWKPAQLLSAFNNAPVRGLWTLSFRDVTNPFDGNDLSDWQLRIQTSFTQCSDGLDNDLDGNADWDGAGLGAADPQCSAPTVTLEQVAVGGCGIGPELALALPLLIAWRRRLA